MLALNASISLGTTSSKTFYYSVADQLYSKMKLIYAVLRENPIKHVTSIHPDVFNSFCRTVTHREFHRIIYKEIFILMVTPIFCIWTSQRKSPKQVHGISTARHPRIIPQNNPRKKVNPVVNNYFCQFQSSSVATIQITTSSKIYLLITTTKIPHCLFQLQIIKS